MILSIVGARPQFVKAAVLSSEFKKRGISEELLHTGQHYDYKMSEVFFEELSLPGLSQNLNLGSGSHGRQTADMLAGIESILLDRPDITHVLVYGDTNSTLAGALAASKLNIPVIHVEAGLRSFNRTMPEEINRVVTDHLSSFLFCSSGEGQKQLLREGISKSVYVVGDIMLDAFNLYSKIASEKFQLEALLPNRILQDYLLLTIHRPSNTDNEENLKNILTALEKHGKPVVWPVHPRNRDRLKVFSVPDNIMVREPFSYFEMMVVLNGCSKVVTDSGGLQKEAYWAKKPCVTVRTETEWIETLHDGWNIIAGSEKQNILNALESSPAAGSWTELYGNGSAAKAMVDVIASNLTKHQQLV